MGWSLLLRKYFRFFEIFAPGVIKNRNSNKRSGFWRVLDLKQCLPKHGDFFQESKKLHHFFKNILNSDLANLDFSGLLTLASFGAHKYYNHTSFDHHNFLSFWNYKFIFGYFSVLMPKRPKMQCFGVILTSGTQLWLSIKISIKNWFFVEIFHFLILRARGIQKIGYLFSKSRRKMTYLNVSAFNEKILKIWASNSKN